MPQTFLNIRGIDPLLFRDGRPFTADAGGLTARSLPLPLPPTIAGFVRTQIGKATGWDWEDEANLKTAHTIPVHAPILWKDGDIVLAAPRDALFGPGSGNPIRLKPRPEWRGWCDLPDLPEGLLPEGLLPVGPDVIVTGKPDKERAYWPRESILKWLAEESPGDIDEIKGLPAEERIGIAIDADTRRAKDSMLYTVGLRAFGERVKDRDKPDQPVSYSQYGIVARVNLPNGYRVSSSGTLGGERRLTAVEPADDTEKIWPRCPPALKEKLAKTKRVRMLLATPACFDHGWLPGWLGKAGNGELHLPAGIGKVGLKLVGAQVGRRAPLSGWGVRERSPRQVRWLVPAGSVYFFKVTGGDPAALVQDSWMEPMSDNEQDRRDGLGLALWGTW